MNIDRTCQCGGTPEKPNPSCERCQLVWLVMTTRKMRTAQKEFFTKRTGTLCQQAQQLERLVDRGIERVTELQPGLFDQ